MVIVFAFFAKPDPKELQVHCRIASNLFCFSLCALFAGCATAPPTDQTSSAAVGAVGLPTGTSIELNSQAHSDDSSSMAEGSLSMANAVQAAVMNSPEIQSALARVRVAQIDAQQSRLLPNPVLNVALRFPSSGTAIIDAGISADLLAVLYRPGKISAADSRLRAASAAAVAQVLDNVSAVQENYVSIQSQVATVALLRQRQALIDRLLGVAEARLKLGEGTRLELVTLQSQRIELDAKIADQQQQEHDTRLALTRQMGNPSAEAKWELNPLPNSPAAGLVSVDECLRVALERRPEIQQRRWELQALGFDRKQAAWSWLEGSDIGAQAERDDSWSVGPAATIPLPLFDMGLVQRDRAIALLIEARHQLTAARRIVIEEVRRAHASFEATLQNLDRVENQLLPLQRDRLAQSELQFKAGQIDLTSLLLAEQDLQNSDALLIELKLRAAVSHIRLERAVGGAGALGAGSNAVPTAPSTRLSTQRSTRQSTPRTP